MPALPTTRYASLTRSQALLVVVGIISSIALCELAVPRQTLVPKSYANKDGGDMAFYAQVVRRIHAGQGYYDALGSELRSSQRATGAVANWRTPLHLSTVAFFPSPMWAGVIVAAGAAVALALSFLLMVRQGAGLVSVLEPLLMLGPLLASFSTPGIYFAEIWAGILIVLSIAAFSFGWWRVGVGAGLLATFFRELALPYAIVSAWLAWRQKRRSETVAWIVGLCAYGVYLAIHASFVKGSLTAADQNPPSWIQFGGLDFILRTASVGWLMILPTWMTAIYLPVSILGLIGWTDAIAVRVLSTVAVYLAAFAMVGHSMNLYWGGIYAPLLTFGAAWSCYAFRDLCRVILTGTIRHSAESRVAGA